MMIRDSHNYLSISGDARAQVNRRRTFILVALMAAVFVWYAVTQMKDVLFSPDLLITIPNDGETVSGNVRVTGKVTKGAVVSLNGYVLGVDESGAFSGELPLVQGFHVLHFEAESTLGKVTVASRQIMVQ